MDLQNVQAGLRHLLPLLDAGRSCVLLCGCYAWLYCHRSLVADLLQRARPALCVSHLSSLVAPAQTVEVEARSRGELGLSLDLTLTHALCGEEEEKQQQQQQESILVTPLTLSVTVPGRGVTTRHLDFVSWPKGGKPGSREQQQHTERPKRKGDLAIDRPLRRPHAQQRHQQQRQQALPPASYDTVEEEEAYEDDDAGGDVWPVRAPSSARRYQAVTTEDVPRRAAAGARNAPQTPVPRRRSAPPPAVLQRQQQYPLRTTVPGEEDTPVRGGPRHLHWLVLVGLAMFTMLIGWVLLTLFSSWWQVTQDDWHYGRPRTYQTVAVVGHHDGSGNPSHYLALNLNSHIEVIEFPGGDASKAKIYLGPTLIGPGQDLAVVTLTFKDANGDGKPDMIVNVEGSHFVFINENGQFRPARPGEQVSP